MMMKLFSRTNDLDALPKKFDVVVEAVRRTEDGHIQVARIYERRGPTWSDRLLVQRDDLIRRIRAGKKVVIGERKEFMASTFQVKTAVYLDGSNLACRGQDDHGLELSQAPLF